MKTTIFIPISRPDHLDKLFSSLERLQCDANDTGLLTYVDGSIGLYGRAAQLTEGSKFASRRCVQRVSKDKVQRHTNLLARRKRIAAIQNEVKVYLEDCEYIFGLEDDTIPPPRALERLLADYGLYPYAGFIEGVELGRHSAAHVGAWIADDVYDTTKLESLLPPDGYQNLMLIQSFDRLQEIDAGGLYCYLTKTVHFTKHEHKPYDIRSFGPDVDYGLELRRRGLQNFIDWSVQCQHLVKIGEGVSLSNTQPVKVIATLKDGRWHQQILAA